MNTETTVSLKALYYQDYYLWLETTAKQIEEGNLEQIDFINLLEEIESMGRSEKSSLESNLKILLLHLLKYKYQPQERTNSWLASIEEHRQRIENTFRDSPSLKRYFQEIYDSVYLKARRLAAFETGSPLSIFPETSPFTIEESINPDFFPN
jgi:hypothetical protein